MEVSIRKAQLQDAESIAQLSNQLGYLSHREAIKERLSEILIHPEHCAFVALEEETVIGWIHGFYTLRIESDPFVEIGGLVVDTNHRKKGIGQMLVTSVLEWSKSRNCLRIRVRSNTIRTESHKFYTRLGFRENKEQKVFNKELQK